MKFHEELFFFFDCHWITSHWHVPGAQKALTYVLNKCILQMPKIQYARGRSWHGSLQKDSSLGFTIQKIFKENLPRARYRARKYAEEGA